MLTTRGPPWLSTLAHETSHVTGGGHAAYAKTRTAYGNSMTTLTLILAKSCFLPCAVDGCSHYEHPTVIRLVLGSCNTVVHAGGMEPEYAGRLTKSKKGSDHNMSKWQKAAMLPADTGTNLGRKVCFTQQDWCKFLHLSTFGVQN